MIHRNLRHTLLLGLLALAPACLAAQDRPNVLFILVDDLNDWVGAMDGHPQAHTPNIDRLAGQGTLFTNAHCQAPICGPSRASFWTGLLPSTTGIYLHIADNEIQNAHPRAAEAAILPDLFEQAGYHSLGAGKLFHNGDRANVFDEYGPGFDFGPRPGGGVRLNFEPRWLGPSITSTDWGAFPETDAGLPDDRIGDWAVRRLDEGIGEPFFMGVGFVRPHVPWYVPQKWFDLFDEASLDTPPYLPGDLDDVPAIARLIQVIPGYPTTDWAQLAREWQAIVHAYLACTAFTDYQVGRVLDALERSPYADNTLVVFFSDHGYHLGEKNRFAKMALWERSTKVPLIVAGPGLPAGRKLDAPVGLIDVYPTALELAGLPPAKAIEGHSLAPLIRGERDDWPHVALTTHGRNNHAVRSANFRYIVYENGAEELYDHREDPWEHHNLAGDPAYADVIGRLRAHLPENDAPLAEQSELGVNEYFKQRMPVWRGK